MPHHTSDKNRIAPNANKLMATPEMMWLTLKVTVATAWMRPPRAPPTMARRRPTHGPHFQAPTAPNQVPKIIMPSMPMFTTPTRSAHRPARPARRIGIVNSRVVNTVNEADSLRASSTLALMNDITMNKNAMVSRVRRLVRARIKGLPTGGDAIGVSVSVALILRLLPVRVRRPLVRRFAWPSAR